MGASHTPTMADVQSPFSENTVKAPTRELEDLATTEDICKGHIWSNFFKKNTKKS